MRAFVVVCAALASVGCGGGAGVTRDEWARAADAICAEYERRFDSLGTADGLPELARLLDQAASLLDNERRELRRLEPPVGDEARVRQMLAHLERMTASATEAREAARRGDQPAVSVAIGESDSAASQARHIAGELGARTCAQP